jgi:hypothetical protein
MIPLEGPRKVLRAAAWLQIAQCGLVLVVAIGTMRPPWRAVDGTELRWFGGAALLLVAAIQLLRGRGGPLRSWWWLSLAGVLYVLGWLWQTQASLTGNLHGGEAGLVLVLAVEAVQLLLLLLGVRGLRAAPHPADEA